MENRPQRTDFQVFVIWYDDSCVRRLTSEDYVTAFLTLHDESYLRQSFEETLPR